MTRSTKHWSEVLSCRCGARFRSLAAEAVHRHNFPALCRAPRVRRPRPRPKKEAARGVD